MRLLRVELTRFRSRRINQLAVLGILGVAMVMLFGTWQSSRPPSAEEIAQIQENFDANLRDWEENGAGYIADCISGEKAEQETYPDADWQCDSYAPPEINDFFYRSPSFADGAASVLPDFGMLLVFAAFAMGVSFIAAEFSSGAIGNWLTFEPRRGRVYGTKVGASGISAIPITVVAAVIVISGTWLVNSLNDNLGTVTADTWRDVGQSGLRLLVLTAAFAMLGVAVGTIVRHTAAALGIIVGYVIVVEGIIGGFFQNLRPWLLQLNLSAVLNDGATYGTEVCKTGSSGLTCEWVEKTVSFSHGAITVGVVVLVAVIVAALVFRRRDVN